MPLSFVSVTSLAKLRFFLHVLGFFLVIFCYGAEASDNKKVTNVGAILNVGSRTGREQRAAMEIAAQNFNDSSKDHELLLYFEDSRRQSLDAASYAEKMIEENKVEVLVGMDTWQEAALVGKLGNRTQVPVVSLAAPSVAPPLMQLRWPYLLAMANDATYEIECIADLVCAYNWKKVVVIYEDDEYGSDLGALSLLNEALQKRGAEIEYRLALSPYSSLSDPKGVIIDELTKLLSVQSRAFVVLPSSLPMVTHLFSEARKLELLEQDSAWIIAESVTSLLNSVDHSVISSMEGALGIKTYYNTSTSSYKDFQKIFGKKNPQEGDPNPGIHALRAYDSIKVITQALERMGNTSGKLLLESLQIISFDGLSGKVSFQEGKLWPSPVFRIVNLVNNTEKELDYWMPEFGFLDSLDTEKGQRENRRASICRNSQGLSGRVLWPGNLENRKPKGWAMPSIARPLKIAVPGDTQFNKFVTIDDLNKNSTEGYDGFCIQIFRKVLEHLDYNLPHQFFEVKVDTYDELIQTVYNKTYDAIVGDVTILAERLNYVEFTQPYTESRLSMVVPIKSEESPWMFVKPFTWEMWVSTGAILFYTMFIVWFLEHPENPEFNGSWTNQISTTLWFMFSSLFFAHRERIHSNITRVVVIMWLFVVLILTASYTASLSSMLTVRQLEQNIDIDLLKQTEQKIGCGDSFVRRYLENVLHFKPENIYDVIPDEHQYMKLFKENNITAAFLETPYEKVFLNKHCEGYTTPPQTYRFGGLGFAFQKGSPIARDFSEAILTLSEDGNITSLEKHWLTPLEECSSTGIRTNKTESLSLQSFWGIYLIFGAISTACFLLSLACLQKNYWRLQRENEVDQSIKHKMLGLARYFYIGKANNRTIPTRTSSSNMSSANGSEPNLDECSSSRGEFARTSNAPDHPEISLPVEIEITAITSDNHDSTQA